jgi:ribosome-binding ATPase YchF (GTP1/OBG family)
MSLTITTYVDENNFVNYNPWFSLSLDKRFNRFLYSNDLKSVINTQIRDQYSSLWRQHVESDSEYKRLLEKLNLHTEKGIISVQNATERKVKELTENTSEMLEIKKIVSATLISDLKTYRKETAEKLEKMDEKFEKMERETDNKIFSGFCLGILFTTLMFYKYS